MPTGIYTRTEAHKEAARKRGCAHLNTPDTHKKSGLSRRGIKFSDEWRKNLSLSHMGQKPAYIPHFKGDKHGQWKGDKVGYRALHHWVVRQLGKPSKCAACPKEGTGHAMHWANISHAYQRVTTDWVRLCAKCHKAYDRNELVLPLL